MFTGMEAESIFAASLKRLNRLSPETLLFQGVDLPAVGKPSVSKNMLSGEGVIPWMALSPFVRLVPFSGTIRRRLLSASFNCETSLTFSHFPSVPAMRGAAVSLKV